MLEIWCIFRDFSTQQIDINWHTFTNISLVIILSDSVEKNDPYMCMLF